MNFTEHLLTCASEECGEIVQAVGKLSRFGAGNRHPDGGLTNGEQLLSEVQDLIAVVELLQREGVIPHSNLTERREKEKKKIKVLQFAELSVALGTLDGIPPYYNYPNKENK